MIQIIVYINCVKNILVAEKPIVKKKKLDLNDLYVLKLTLFNINEQLITHVLKNFSFFRLSYTDLMKDKSKQENVSMSNMYQIFYCYQ